MAPKDVEVAGAPNDNEEVEVILSCPGVAPKLNPVVDLFTGALSGNKGKLDVVAVNVLPVLKVGNADVTVTY